MQQKPSTLPNWISQEKIITIQQLLADKVEEVLEELEVDSRHQSNMRVGACPIHQGDNPGAFNMYLDGHSTAGNWRCNTHHCERIFKPSIIGFIRGVLSANVDWEEGKKPTVSFQQTIGWCLKFLGLSLNQIDDAKINLEKTSFTRMVNRQQRKSPEANKWAAAIKERLIIPSVYFTNRGYSREILTRHQVGDCNSVGKYFYRRSVVPVYEQTGQTIVGLTGRANCERCKDCGLFCFGECGDNNAKWINTTGNWREETLYNFYRAAAFVKKKGVVCLCEGPGDVWRLEESGIDCGVAVMGSALTEKQQITLELSGALTVISLLDNDEAGLLGHQQLEEKAGRLFRIVRPEFEKKDIGGCSIEHIRQKVLSLVEGYSL